MNTILAVVRESTEQQEIDSQVNEMKAFCNSIGYTNIEWISVQGASARKANKKYTDMLESIKATIISKDIKAVAFWHLNRLGRIESYIMNMKEWFVKNHIQVYVKNPSLTLLDKDGNLDAGANIAWSVFAAMVAYDTEEMFEKTKRGKARNKAEGKANGGYSTVPFGYRIDESKHVVPDWEQAEIVKLVYTEFAKGTYSIRSLVRELEERGIKGKNGKHLTSSVVDKMLRTNTYIGEVNKNGRTYEAIIDKELWVKANNCRKDTGKAIKETRNYHLCIKLLKCWKCNHNYFATGDYYYCYLNNKMNALNTHKDKCDGSSIKIEFLDTLVWDQIVSRHLAFIANQKELAEEDRSKKLAILKVKEDEITKQYEKVELQKKRAKQMYMDLDLTEKEYQTQLAKILLKENELNAQLKRIEVEISKQIAYQPIDVITNVVNATKEEKRNIARMHIDHIFIKAEGNYKVVEIYYKDGDIEYWKYNYMNKWAKERFTLLKTEKVAE